MTATQITKLADERRDLIEDVTSHAPGAIDANIGGWASDRLNAIRATEWDLVTAGVELQPFIRAHHRLGVATDFGPVTPKRDVYAD
jgi:hypothetical protein